MSAHSHLGVVQTFGAQGFDPDALAGLIRNAHFEYRLLAGGNFRARHRRLVLGASILESGEYNAPLFAQGAFSRDRLVIGFNLGGREPGNINGQPVFPGSVRIFSEGCEISYRTARDVNWSSLRVTREHLQAKAVDMLGRPLPVPRTGWLNLMPTSAAARLAHAIRDAFALPQRAQVGLSPAALTSLSDQLLGVYVSAIADGLQVASGARSGATQRRAEALRRARDYFHANVRQPFSVRELGAATGCSERVLQYLFRDVYGMSPQQWFRAIKLNEVRRELRAGIPQGTRVTEVAIRYGFMHLGRFSAEYRRLFGEAPSQTLGRR